MPQLLLANKTPKQVIIGEGQHQYEVQHGFAQLPAKYTWQTTHNVQKMTGVADRFGASSVASQLG